MADSASDLVAASGWIVVSLLVLSTLAGAILVSGPVGGTGAKEPAASLVVTPVENGTGLWPYTARAPNHRARTLAINVVVLGESDYVREALLNRTGPTWTETPPEKEAAEMDTFAAAIDEGNETDQSPELLFWGPARGSTRYAYIVEDGVGERWVTESYQVHDGTYFGHRTHVRAYEDPRGEWTAMQAHDEYWDWFRLRHTVTGVSSAQEAIERDFLDAPFVNGVVRHPYHHGAPGGGSWVTVVHFSLIVVPGLVAFRLDRVQPLTSSGIDRFGRELALGVALMILYLGVRWLGIGLERRWPTTDPHHIAAPLYLLLVLGLPLIAGFLARNADPGWAFTSATIWLAIGFFIDAVLMQVSVLPLPFILHRTAVLFAIGLVAYGSAFVTREGWRTPMFAGIIGWVAVIVPPALGYL